MRNLNLSEIGNVSGGGSIFHPDAVIYFESNRTSDGGGDSRGECRVDDDGRGETCTTYGDNKITSTHYDFVPNGCTVTTTQTLNASDTYAVTVGTGGVSLTRTTQPGGITVSRTCPEYVRPQARKMEP